MAPMPGSPPSSSTRPSRTLAWSSAMTMRNGGPAEPAGTVMTARSRAGRGVRPLAGRGVRPLAGRGVRPLAGRGIRRRAGRGVLRRSRSTGCRGGPRADCRSAAGAVAAHGRIVWTQTITVKAASQRRAGERGSEVVGVLAKLPVGDETLKTLYLVALVGQERRHEVVAEQFG